MLMSYILNVTSFKTVSHYF